MLIQNFSLIVGSTYIAIFSVVGLGLHLRSWYTYGYQFFWSFLCFIFCVARILAIGLRIALKNDLTNKALACTGQIVLSAGIALLVSSLAWQVDPELTASGSSLSIFK
jgi:hypothetical protein